MYCVGRLHQRSTKQLMRMASSQVLSQVLPLKSDISLRSWAVLYLRVDQNPGNWILRVVVGVCRPVCVRQEGAAADGQAPRSASLRLLAN